MVGPSVIFLSSPLSSGYGFASSQRGPSSPSQFLYSTVSSGGEIQNIILLIRSYGLFLLFVNEVWTFRLCMDTLKDIPLGTSLIFVMGIHTRANRYEYIYAAHSKKPVHVGIYRCMLYFWQFRDSVLISLPLLPYRHRCW